MRTIQVVNVRWYNATAWYGVTLAHCLQKTGHESIVAGLEGTPPLEKAKECDLVFCELTHYPLEKALPVLAQIKPEKLVFYHLHTPHQSIEGGAKVMEKCAILPYPVILAKDGEEVEL